jgi:FkbM family methyltransferase
MKSRKQFSFKCLRRYVSLIKQLLIENNFRFNTLTSRGDTKIMFGLYEARLPKGHRLPLLRKIYPNYDRYFIQFFTELNNAFTSGTLIDIGANIGDTTLEVLSTAPKFKSIAVEGSQLFLNPLKLNTQIIRERVQVVERFVYSERLEKLEYKSDLTTGGFKHLGVNAAPSEKLVGDSDRFIDVVTLLELAEGDVVVWKSDTDGLDIPILLENYQRVTADVDVIWIEIHPHLPPTSLSDIEMLTELLSESEFVGVLFDNFGCVVGHGEGESLGAIVLSNCQKLSPKTQRLQKSPFYFDLVAFKSSLGNSELRQRLLNALLTGNIDRSD